ncbi:MAG: ATPase, T2SS/T4P/T4SS family [Dehalococcoidia bacterium]|nr:ATPase, T2SS/T4P/T4SS family [Dehalococcoidia bacterium]
MSNAETRPLIVSIDDDEDILALTRKFLMDSGYDVITTTDAVEGLEKISQAKPSLILLDVVMPKMNGYQVCAALRQNDETVNIPVVFLTAQKEEQDKARAFAVGAVDYLVKPVSKGKLLQTVEAHLATGKRWKQLSDGPSPWEGGLSSRSFISFKESLFLQLDLKPEQKYQLSSVRFSDIYSSASKVGIAAAAIARHMADFLGVPYVTHINPDSIELGVLAPAFCKSYHVVPIRDEDGLQAFLMSNPFDLQLMDTLKGLGGSNSGLRILLSDPENIEMLVGNPGAASGANVKISRPDLSKQGQSPRKPEEQSIPDLANSILERAVASRASDIHIEPKESRTLIRIRVDGDLQDILSLAKETGVQVISRMKVIGDMNIAEMHKPQDGSFMQVVNERTFNFRLSTTSTPYGESLVTRLLEPYAEPKGLTQLGMTDAQVSTIKALATRSAGCILVVGPTGSGKTTTVLNVLHVTDYKSRSVISAEDPVEYRIPFVNQQQVSEKAGVTFEALLKAVVRQDPDILFVGEIRDPYSAKVALDFASTGHLTISTMHTSNATTAITRMERLGIPREVIAQNVNAVIAQRLIRKLCDGCKKVEPMTPEEIEMMTPFTNVLPKTVAHPVGCSKCNHTGFYGREGIQEILAFDPVISEMVRDGVPISEIRAFSHSRGDYMIGDHALQKMEKLIFCPKDVYEKVLIEEIRLQDSPAQTRTVRAEVPSMAARVGGADIDDEAKSTVAVSPPLVAAAQPKSILVVDDDEDTRNLLSLLLTKQGYIVEVASDGIDAMMSLSKSRHDLVMSDVNMPNLDGFKLLEVMSQKGINVPAILLTSRESASDEEKGMLLGAFDYIRKPINKEILLMRVGRVFQRR